MKRVLFIVFLLISNIGISQIGYEKGYFISNDDLRTECLIKNNDWVINPSNFKYKTHGTDKVSDGNISSIKEFGIYNHTKFLRSNINLDVSSHIESNLDHGFKPNYEKREVFLKQLVAGDANLYVYTNDNTSKYFYNKGIDTLIPLVYKFYLVGRKVATNETYKQQLLEALKCPTFNFDDLKSFSYNLKDLTRIFVKYNECTKSESFKIFTRPKSKLNLVTLSIRPRVSQQEFNITNSTDYIFVDFEKKTNFSIGAELEIILPFNKNKWRVLLEPSYQYYKGEKSISNIRAMTVDYKAIELPIDIRHYFFLNNKSALFLNAQYVLDINMDSHFRMKLNNVNGVKYKIVTKAKLAFGGGFSFLDRHKLEFRYFLNKKMLDSYGQWNAEGKGISLIYGYKLF